MKFAVISDIHGNLLTLDAVLEDAKSREVNAYIFAGDYCLSNPYPNECITRIRELKNSYVVCGNEEKYFFNLREKSPNTWTDGQMQVTYWGYRKMSSENLNYVLNLPAQIDTLCNGVRLHIAHSSAQFIEDGEHREWRPTKVTERYQKGSRNREQFCYDIQNSFQQDASFQRIFGSLSDGVYIFGHTHLQWNYRSEDGKKLLLNPGSAGLPLDYSEGIPYTILEISEDGIITLEEQRIPYDKGKCIEAMQQSEQYEKAYVWSKIITEELRTAREHVVFFLRFAEGYATKLGDDQRPFSVPTWEAAFAAWQQEDFPICKANPDAW